jgi:hypothetical protein
MNYRVAWSHDLSNVKQVIVVRMMASSIWKGVKASVASSFRVQYTCNKEVSFLSARSELPAGQVNAQAKSHKPIFGFHSSLSLILSPPKHTRTLPWCNTRTDTIAYSHVSLRRPYLPRSPRSPDLQIALSLFLIYKTRVSQLVRDIAESHACMSVEGYVPCVCLNAGAYTCRCSRIAYKFAVHKASRCADSGVTVSLVVAFSLGGRSSWPFLLRLQTVGAVRII